MDVTDVPMALDAEERRASVASSDAQPPITSQNGTIFMGDANGGFRGFSSGLEPEIDACLPKVSEPAELRTPLVAAASSLVPVVSTDVALNDATMDVSDSAFATSMASFTSDLHAELARLTTGPVASLYFSSETPSQPSQLRQCACCFATLDMVLPDAYTATAATFCLCCCRPILVPGIEYVQEEDTAFPRCAPCMLARLPTKPVVEEDWWPAQYKHALLRAVENKLWDKLIEVGNLPQSGESARHQLYHRRHQLENAQRVHERKILEVVRNNQAAADPSVFEGLFGEWRDLQAREDAENFRIIVLLSKCLQEIERGVPPEVGEALQICRGRDLRSEHQANKLASTLWSPMQCGCCPAVLTIPAPSGVPLPNPCFCFCCARMVPESLMYQSENASKPANGDLCLDCAAAHDDLERKWFLVNASPTMMDWKRHKVAMGLERQLRRVRASTAAAYKGGCDSDKDLGRWRVADGAALQWQSRTESIASEQRAVLRRGWTPVADSRQCYAAQAEFEKKFVVAIPPLLKVLANLLVRQRIATGSDDARVAAKRTDGMDDHGSDGRDLKLRKV